MIFSSMSDTGDPEEKFWVPPTGVEPIIFWLLVQMLYHRRYSYPYSYRSLMRAKAIKLGPCDKHSAYF